MELELLETDPPGAVGFQIGFCDHRLQQVVGIVEWLESVLPRNSGKIPGGGKLHGACQFQIDG
jgi:hypothetical protein